MRPAFTMMGCGTSNSATAPTSDGSRQPDADDTQTIGDLLATDTAFAGMVAKETVYDAYVRLDHSINHMEQSCPGPRLATVDAWSEHLQQMRPPSPTDNLVAIAADDALDASLTISTPMRPLDADRRSLDAERAAIVRLAVQLNVALDVGRARANESHLAEVSARHLEHIARDLHADIVAHTSQRAGQLLELYGRLRSMYDEQDGLLASVTSGSYSSAAEERLDHRLDAARQVRDKLGAVAEQWRIAGNLLRTGAKEAIRASECWSLVAHSTSAAERVQLALDAQAAGQAAIIAIDYAHKSLPHVDFPHMTRRRIVATRHACEYLLTDMADRARCAHTAAVLDAFRASVEQTHRWLHDTFRRTLRTNLSEAETAVGQVAKQLNAERSRYMRASETAHRMYVGPPSGALATVADYK